MENVDIALIQNPDDQDTNVTALPSKRSLEYTTENFKIEVSNLPKHIKFHVVKNILEHNYKLDPHKIKLGDRRAYIAFKSEKERDEALVKINSKDWKGRALVASIAGPREDVLYKKARTNQESDSQRKEEQIEHTDDDINNKVNPLWNMPYNEQLQLKDEAMRRILNIGKEVRKICPNLSKEAPELHKWIIEHRDVCCKYDGIVPSPRLVGYRNKCEFNVDKDGIIGFKMGRYRDGSDRVSKPPRNCPIINKLMFTILDAFQGYLSDKSKTKLRGYCRVTHDGNIRQLTLRTNEKNESMIIIDLHPQDLSKEELDNEIDQICDLFKSIDGVISIYKNVSDKDNLICTSQTLKLAYGQKHLHEHLSIIESEPPLKFCISPSSFFQVNTKAAELLYKSIIDLAELDSNSLVLDMGCGTGTISLSLARHVNQVIGVELIAAAIEDAKANAKENNITNALFFAGRAEDFIQETISILKSKQSEQVTKGEIVAVVDPPRNGFNNSFIKALRASSIKKIIYVACDAAANTNLITLCRPKSKAYLGDPFVPTRARGFDLFPHTKFCELVLVYERLNSSINE